MAAKFLVFCGLVSLASATIKLQEIFSWNVVDWNYPDQFSKQQALRTGALIPENALPVGIERWRNKLFVSVPRWRSGIPATLNYIPLDAPYEPSPKLTPYPSFEGNELGNCQTGLTTVYRVKADQCDRLWVLDVGTYGYDNVTNVCPYTLNVFDLNTDQIIRKYVLRPEDIVSTTFIANIALDIGTSCEDTFAYFSDELGYGLIAYSWEQNKSWRFSHSYFMPDPLVGDFNIAGLNFQWGAEGIFGITASPIGADGYRTLYFSPLSSHTEFSVSTRILRDETKVKGSYKDFSVVGVRGPDGHTTAKVMDDSGVQLFNLIDQNAVGCWRSSLPYKPQNIGIADKDDVGLVFPVDVKIDDEKNVWVMSDRMAVFLEAELDYSDINFRVYTAPLDTLIQGTVCEAPLPVLQAQQILKPLQPIKALPRAKLYNHGLGVTATPFSEAVAVYRPGSTKSELTGSYRQPIIKNTAPKVQNYIYIPKQTSSAYTSGQFTRPKSTNKNPWWNKATNYNYEVFEP
ncbi:protein yellow-like [Bombyx mandarina]|uniref:Protein yellow n=3 Tax=Bombyx TaxID=7090 RepID=A0A6J2JV56_BOMMA|nr:protein yellow-like [Bombyx mandarina]XP_028033212.1 protein yellow-like [Bombyx mandarina]XP_028033213.1 protein yellow-like [Bombyx mandarina]